MEGEKKQNRKNGFKSNCVNCKGEIRVSWSELDKNNLCSICLEDMLKELVTKGEKK